MYDFAYFIFYFNFIYICLTLSVCVCVCVQVFTELEQVGSTIQEEVQDAGLGHGHGGMEMQGDINTCPYYAAKMGTLPGPSVLDCL